jgi:hypothetical protein
MLARRPQVLRIERRTTDPPRHHVVNLIRVHRAPRPPGTAPIAVTLKYSLAYSDLVTLV